MSSAHSDYVNAIATGFPTCIVEASGPEYHDIVYISGSPIPSKQSLDDWILVDKKNDMWVSIQAERTRRQAGGVFLPSIGKWFHSDQQTRIQYLALMMMGNNIPANINWKTMDGTFVIMTAPIVAAVFAAIPVLDITAFAVAEQHKAACWALSDPTTYNFSAGWPAIYNP